MALFQKRPEVGQAIQFYTLGQNKQILIVGLGNPGSEYDNTRHNIGFKAVDSFVEANDFTSWINKKDLKCLMSTARLGEAHVICVKPTTYMNLSGEAVQAVAHFYKIAVQNIAAVYDEIDINFGQIRMRTGGGSAGHNGVKSLIQHLGEDFGRVRIGIGPKKPEQMDSADFVLAKFDTEESSNIPQLTRETNAILSEYSYSDANLMEETRNFIV